MLQFSGFSARKGFFSVPNQLVTELLPQMDDIGQLKTILCLLGLTYARKGYKFFTLADLMKDAPLRDCFPGAADEALGEVLSGYLRAFADRSILIRCSLSKGDKSTDLYFFNNESNRDVIARIENGRVDLDLEGELAVYRPSASLPRRDNIFSLYEKNIGVLTPIIAEQLKAAEKSYPETWIVEAFEEAAVHQKLSWRYIEVILERWSTEGKGRGEYKRNTGKNEVAEKARRGKYRHLVQH